LRVERKFQEVCRFQTEFGNEKGVGALRVRAGLAVLPHCQGRLPPVVDLAFVSRVSHCGNGS
jgi:hypothetical protein